jgi:hypothetical protein
LVFSSTSVRAAQAVACVQFELFSYLIIYQFN